MKTVADVMQCLERIAPKAYQESYDNVGLLVGEPRWEVSGIKTCLDITVPVLEDALVSGCNLVIAHHPIIFGGLKRIHTSNEVERVVRFAIKNDIALYAAHTNLDNVLHGISGTLAQRIGLQHVGVLAPKSGILAKIIAYAPAAAAEQVLQAAFAAGAGHIGHYTSCAFETQGMGRFTPLPNSHPAQGSIGQPERYEEIKVEVLAPLHQAPAVVHAMQSAHPFEEMAYDIVPLVNAHQEVGSGAIGALPKALSVEDFLEHLGAVLGCESIAHSAPIARKIETVAVCGGAGVSFLKEARAQKADVFVTGDCKYHDFPVHDANIMLVDVGHYASEKHAAELLAGLIRNEKPIFAVSISGAQQNPVRTYLHGSNR